ncbi:MAG: hypothetical protein VZQ50_06505, partial [Lachnospiraceae bacterium]|nr:hypothetical protein [Lachnospiraceae bacterium]
NISNNTDYLLVGSLSLHYLLDTSTITFISLCQVAETFISGLKTDNRLVIFLNIILNQITSL